MSLTAGWGPFSGRRVGVFNFEAPERGVLYWEPSPRRVRALFNGETIIDSKQAMLLHESRYLPVYYFPRDDVRMDLLEPSARRTTCPHKGAASYWTVRVGEREADDAAWSYPEPIRGAPPLAGYLAFYWQKLDRWYEEDEEVFVHPRDPYHRVDVLETSRRVQVRVGGEVVAVSTRACALFETGLPPRWYLPLEDVRTELLTESETTTRCPYKGLATYWSLGDEDDLVWSYAEPTHAVEPIAGRLAFFNERVDLEVDGELQERPRTQWSR